MSEREKALEAALLRWQSYGCPDCSGDCGSANPPVFCCIMQETRAALAMPATEDRASWEAGRDAAAAVVYADVENLRSWALAEPEGSNDRNSLLLHMRAQAAIAKNIRNLTPPEDAP